MKTGSLLIPTESTKAHGGDVAALRKALDRTTLLIENADQLNSTLLEAIENLRDAGDLSSEETQHGLRMVHSFCSLWSNQRKMEIHFVTLKKSWDKASGIDGLIKKVESEVMKSDIDSIDAKSNEENLDLLDDLESI